MSNYPHIDLYEGTNAARADHILKAIASASDAVSTAINLVEEADLTTMTRKGYCDRLDESRHLWQVMHSLSDAYSDRLNYVLNGGTASTTE